MKELKNYLIVMFAFMMLGVGCALTLKGGIGVAAWDALAQTGYDLFHIKAGTISIILNCSCVLGELLILRKDFKFTHLLQVPCSILLGGVVNIVLYDILSYIQVEHYLMNMGLFIIGTIWNAFFVALMMHMDVVTTALEGLCMATTRILPFKFHQIRQAVDVFIVVTIIIVSFTFHIPSSVREGTVISMLIFGPLLGVFMNKIKNISLAIQQDL